MYRYRRYRYPCRTELTKVSGTGIDVVPNLPNEVSGTGIIDVVPDLPKGPVPEILPVCTPVCLGTHRTKHTRGAKLSFNHSIDRTHS